MYKKILVPLDGSPTAERGLQEAIGLALVHHARLHLLHVIDMYPVMIEVSGAAVAFDTMREELKAQGQAILDKAQRTAEAAGVATSASLSEVTAYRASTAIVETAKAEGCDLIVMGTHGRRGFSRALLGSDAEAVVRTAEVPVLLVRPAA